MKKENSNFSAVLSLFIALGFSFVLLAVSYFINSNDNVLPTRIIFEKETDYYSAQVVDATFSGGGAARILFLDFGSHSIEYKDTRNIPLTYLSIYPVFNVFKPSGIKTINVIGGGAYILPQSFSDFYNNSEVTVIEVDEEVSDMARKYFNINYNRISTVTQDARVYFYKNKDTYDVIFGDAFNSFISVPWHLVTSEFTELAEKRLNDDGVYAVNFISALKGESSAFFNSMAKTFSDIFPNYYVFALGRDLSSVQNIVLVGVKGDAPRKTIPQIKKELSGSPDTSAFADLLVDMNNFDLSGAIVLSDDFAPVEHLMLTAIRSYFPKYLSFYNMVFKQ